MDPQLFIVAVCAYLLGSIPFGYILVKLFLKQDIRETGSGNIGATNVARSGNKLLGVVTLLLDAGKGALAVILGMGLSHNVFVEPNPGWVWAAFFAILGHMFPVWLKFKGGKGVATAVGAFALLSPKSILVAIATFAVIFAATRYVSLSSIISAAVFPLAVYFLEPQTDLKMLTIIAAASLLIILKHHDNIRRLIAGTENRFGSAKPTIPAEKTP